MTPWHAATLIEQVCYI